MFLIHGPLYPLHIVFTFLFSCPVNVDLLLDVVLKTIQVEVNCMEISIPFCLLDQSSKLFHQSPDNKYFLFCRPCSLKCEVYFT